MKSARDLWYDAAAHFDKWIRHDALCGIIGGYDYCTCGLDDARSLHRGE